MILQLAKTSPYLTGQFKLDVELYMSDGVIRTGDCHVSPLADNLGETDSSDVPFFNCKLTDSIKRLYNRLGDNFFCDSPSISAEKILYNNKWTDTYDHTYQAGVSRMRYEKYGKQFQLLCPVWTDTADELLGGKFTFKVRGWNTDVLTCETDLVLSQDLVNSLHEYMDGMTSDLLNINLDREEVTVKGLDVTSGTVVTKDVSYMLEKMLDRERPVIETDSLLCQLLPANKMIARQLINLNFCFNITDIMPPYLANGMELNRWTIWVDMKHWSNDSGEADENSELVDTEYRDLYTNYTEVPSYVTDDANGFFDQSRNALDYLEDHHCIDYIFTNKVTQPIFHWALVENPDYLFNFYNGFSPVNRGTEQDTLTEGLFFNQPNPYQKEYKPGTNTLTWCNILDIRSTTDGLQRLQNIGLDADKNFTMFSGSANSMRWINGMKFEFGWESFPQKIYINIVYANESLISQIGSAYSPQKPYLYCHDSTGSQYVVSILLDPSNPTALDSCTLWNILNNSKLSTSFNGNAYPSGNQFDVGIFLTELSAMFSNYVYPWKVVFNKSLYADRVESPSTDSKEIRYYKSDVNHTSSLYRYTGSLRPMMPPIGIGNYYNVDYFAKVMSEDFLATEQGNAYNNFLKTGYSQSYPSIGYFPLEYEIASETPSLTRYPEQYEVKWGKNGRIWCLPEEITLEFTTGTENPITEADIYGFLKTELCRRVSSQYPTGDPNAPAFSETWDCQLRSAYKYKVNYDYLSDEDISGMRFHVVYKLR